MYKCFSAINHLILIQVKLQAIKVTSPSLCFGAFSLLFSLIVTSAERRLLQSVYTVPTPKKLRSLGFPVTYSCSMTLLTVPSKARASWTAYKGLIKKNSAL